MVGLVLVGHSAAVVDGLAAMVRQAAPGVPVEAAGGLCGVAGSGTSGPTSPARCRRALAAAGEAGVVVLLDLGSAALALDIALDELGDEARARVRVTEAPFVEGAVHRRRGVGGRRGRGPWSSPRPRARCGCRSCPRE